MFIFELYVLFLFFKQKTAYEMRISDWSSDVCSSDLPDLVAQREFAMGGNLLRRSAAPLRGVGFRGFFSCTPKQVAGVGIGRHRHLQIGRASCRERVCQYVEISVVAVSLKTKQAKHQARTHSISTTHRKLTT